MRSCQDFSHRLLSLSEIRAIVKHVRVRLPSCILLGLAQQVRLVHAVVIILHCWVLFLWTRYSLRWKHSAICHFIQNLVNLSLVKELRRHGVSRFNLNLLQGLRYLVLLLVRVHVVIVQVGVSVVQGARVSCEHLLAEQVSH